MRNSNWNDISIYFPYPLMSFSFLEAEDFAASCHGSTATVFLPNGRAVPRGDSATARTNGRFETVLHREKKPVGWNGGASKVDAVLQFLSLSLSVVLHLEHLTSCKQIPTKTNSKDSLEEAVWSFFMLFSVLKYVELEWNWSGKSGCRTYFQTHVFVKLGLSTCVEK